MPENRPNLLDEMGRKDYIFVVGKLKEKFKDEKIRMDVAQIFIDMFKQDNERFDASKFLAAAGLKPLSEANKVVDKAKWEQLKKKAQELGLDPAELTYPGQGEDECKKFNSKTIKENTESSLENLNIRDHASLIL